MESIHNASSSKVNKLVQALRKIDWLMNDFFNRLLSDIEKSYK